MSESTPLVPPSRGGLGDRILRWCFLAVLRASLLVSPRPAALLVRRVFASGGARTAEILRRHAPAGVVAQVDERYGEEPDMLLDVYRPAAADGRLPLLLWVHGGGFCGGSKEELAGYFELVASNGYVVVAPRYSLAPEHRYPTPPRQMMQALDHLQRDAERLQIDQNRIAIAGDSAGAHIAAQLGALVTTPGYADAVGIVPTIAASQVRGLVLCCGPYDLGLARAADSPAGHRFGRIILRAYSGERAFLEDPGFATWSVADSLTRAFPPVLVTVGNADPLRPHSELLVERLQAEGAEVETLFFPADHEPPLGHEYQFDLDTDAGQVFRERLLEFLGHRLAVQQA
jgi:acetyl esterase/lipase